jgi:hypothetical protein
MPPPLNPASCKTRGTSVYGEATAPNLPSVRTVVPEDMPQEADEVKEEEEEMHHDTQAHNDEDGETEEAEDEEEMLQQLLTQCHECTECHSAVFLIATMPGRVSPLGTIM